MTVVPEWNGEPIPNDVQRILVWKRNGGEVIAHKIDGRWRAENGVWLDFKVGTQAQYSFTHWIPLPGPPDGWVAHDPWHLK
jgi:hypothetical protein